MADLPAALKSALKPTDVEVIALARAESLPETFNRFEPICKGPLFAVFAMGCVGVAASPFILVRLIRALFGMGHSRE